MPKAILEFNLDAPEDLLAFKQANSALKSLAALWDIKTNIHFNFKHRELTEDQQKVLEEINEIVTAAIEDVNINLDELYE